MAASTRARTLRRLRRLRTPGVDWGRPTQCRRAVQTVCLVVRPSAAWPLRKEQKGGPGSNEEGGNPEPRRRRRAEAATWRPTNLISGNLLARRATHLESRLHGDQMAEGGELFFATWIWVVSEPKSIGQVGKCQIRRFAYSWRSKSGLERQCEWNKSKIFKSSHSYGPIETSPKKLVSFYDNGRLRDERGGLVK